MAAAESMVRSNRMRSPIQLDAALFSRHPAEDAAEGASAGPKQERRVSGLDTNQHVQSPPTKMDEDR